MLLSLDAQLLTFPFVLSPWSSLYCFSRVLPPFVVVCFFVQENNDTHFHDTETGVELEVTDKQSLVEWIANNYKNFGAALEFITNRYVFAAAGKLHSCDRIALFVLKNNTSPLSLTTLVFYRLYTPLPPVVLSASPTCDSRTFSSYPRGHIHVDLRPLPSPQLFPSLKPIGSVSCRFCRALFFSVDRSQEGSQFCKGFGGIGGILRWRVDFAEMDESNYEDVEDWGEGF